MGGRDMSLFGAKPAAVLEREPPFLFSTAVSGLDYRLKVEIPFSPLKNTKPPTIMNREA